MREWFLNLKVREKQALVLIGLFLSLFFLYELIWAPLSAQNELLRDEIIQNQKLLSWMQSVNQRIEATQSLSKKNSRIKSSSAILSVLQKEVNQSQFIKNLVQMSQAENNSVQLTFQKINFDELIKWITVLWEKDGLTVNQLTATPNGTLGIVDATLILAAN